MAQFPSNLHPRVSVLRTQTKYFWLQVCVFIVSAAAVVSSGVIETRKEKRSFLTHPVQSGHGYSLGLDHSYDGFGLSLGGWVGLAAGPAIGVAAGPVIAASPVTVSKVPVRVPQPVPVPINRPVPVAANAPYSVDVPRPVPVAIPHPVPVTVVRPAPANVPRPVPVPVTVTALQPIHIAHPLPVTVPQPVSLTLHQPVAVSVPQPSLAFEDLRIGGFAPRKGFGLSDSRNYVPSSLHGASYAPSYFSSYKH